MTSSQTLSTAHLPAAVLVDTADALVRAGQAERALTLIDAASATEPADVAQLALAACRAALDRDYRSGTSLGPERLAAARTAVAATDDSVAGWDLDQLKVRWAYFDAILGDSGPRFGPWGRDPRDIDGLRAAAKRLYDASPDDGRRGWAAMYQGWIADNVAGERDVAPVHYREALGFAEATGDDYLVFEALRHLGDHDHDDGQHELAREHWERSTEHAARAGSVAGTLAQQLLVAVLDRESGDEAGARALAREIVRWAGAIGAPRLQVQAVAFLDGVDPTAPPPEAAQD